MTTRSQGQTARLERARLDIARLGLGDSAELARSLAHAARTSAQALDVERVGVWLFDVRRTRLQCLEAYVLSLDRDGPGETLDLTRYPAYAAALEERRFVRADDARADPRTCELQDYLARHGIGAMLDAPVFRGGHVVGVVCHEHVGGPRVWSGRDVDFATSIADMLGALFEQASRLQAEAGAARVERFHALGRLAAGVAHDFNNVLAAVGLCAQSLLLPGRVVSPDELREAARDITEQCARGARLAGQLLALGRQPAGAPGPLDLGEVARETCAALTGLLDGRCEVEVRAEAGCVVRAERARLEQVVMNLVLNARDAARPGQTGRVVVTVRPDVDEAYAALAVRDDGVGMDADTRARCFEASFSTKPEGTGMGLFIVWQAVDALGGTVTVDSAPGAGATFVVRLPRVDAA